MRTVVLDGELDISIEQYGEFDLLIPQSGEFGAITALREGYPEYRGETVVTPTKETQILTTAMTSVLTNIIVNPIPSNYGLITWDGATLTIS